ncbi:MAG TPA: phosphatase PAP2 family protein [Solirubrobacteraceae bacterium]|jgi:membrane-associated phospholipid phosphatase|nr:phosphatase PAP2 family protein [Solirubrobacteraceae bacterium]
MRRAIGERSDQVLPNGPLDVIRQLSLFAIAYLGYEIVRGVVGINGPRPFSDADRIIGFERALHVFTEPQIQAWATRQARWLLDIADWTYLNAHFALTAAALVFIYLRRNDSFYFVRNMFMVAMLIALVGYCVYPAAPPRLMPQWGFSDPVRQFTGVDAEQGAAGLLLNPYAAVPSMHVCFALMIATAMSRLVRRPVARVLWRIYPLSIVFVVVVTGNHYFTDVALGALTAAVSAALAEQLLARARPHAWAFAGVPA